MNQDVRLAEITSCEDCPHVWFYLGTVEKCSLKNKKNCYDDIENDPDIPLWCPLPKKDRNYKLSNLDQLTKQRDWYIETIKPKMKETRKTITDIAENVGMDSVVVAEKLCGIVPMGDSEKTAIYNFVYS